ncbi:MAG: hypothetical protein PHT69_06980 [Bacteroidales bacterium]|nr:hypothetical protein [Bacteroidales bacterium]
MKIKRSILKIKSKLYYYTLVLYGATSMMFFSKCSTTNAVDKNQEINDSISKADSLAQIEKEQALLDSIAQAESQQALLDSITKADSVQRAGSKPNPYRPTTPVTKYGVPFNNN